MSNGYQNKAARMLPATRLLLLAVCFATITCSCSTIISQTIIEPTVSNLQRQNDVELVCEGASSYLLMIDSLIEANPDDSQLLLTGTKAYGGVINALASCGTRAERLQTLSLKAKAYGTRLLTTALNFSPTDLSSLEASLATPSGHNPEHLFWGAYGLLVWIEQQNGSPASLTALIIVERVMQQLLVVAPTIENGGPHLFFGALLGSKPPLLGGNLAQSRNHFETALALSDRTFLLGQLTFARTYCRMAFDRARHDALLNEIIQFPLARAPQNMLVNQIAKRRAAVLLSDGYFD